jgi:acyl-CoA synthetase (AMP-forming)/AMP-acid ligase II
MILFDADHYCSLAEPLQQRARKNPDAPAVALLHNSRSARILSAGELDQAARRYASRLKLSGVGAGEMVAVGLPHGEDLLTAFWGIIYAGAVPSIFAYPGPLMQRHAYAGRLHDFARECAARALITTPEAAATMPDGSGNSCLLIHRPLPGEEDNRTEPYETSCPDRETPTYIQFTSGTTGRRKGAILSHRAVLEFVQSTITVLDSRSEDVMVSWMPFSHDFGLFGGMVFPVCAGHLTVLISPHHWLRRPIIMLEAIHDYRGTFCLNTNSALLHMVGCAMDSDLADLNLRSLRTMIIGAEPVLLPSLERFTEKFTASGLERRMLAPAYGMAENTLTVSIFDHERDTLADWVDSQALTTHGRAMPAQPGDPGAIVYVNCGQATPETRITIRDDSGECLPEREVGEIFFTSLSMFSGYQGRAKTRGPASEGWHATGDLGYMVGANLFVCGRKTDLIIVGGRNIHPEDLEAVAPGISGLDPANTVAFGVMDEDIGTESVIMVCGLSPLPAPAERFSLEKALRQLIYQTFEVTLGDVRFVPRKWIERTSNGKLARHRNREKYLRELGRSPAPSQLPLQKKDD